MSISEIQFEERGVELLDPYKHLLLGGCFSSIVDGGRKEIQVCGKFGESKPLGDLK